METVCYPELTSLMFLAVFQFGGVSVKTVKLMCVKEVCLLETENIQVLGEV